MRLHPRPLLLAFLLFAGLAGSAAPALSQANYVPVTKLFWPAPMLLRNSYMDLNTAWDGVTPVLHGDSTVIWAPCGYKNIAAASSTPTGIGIFVDSVLTTVTSLSVANSIGTWLEPSLPVRGGLHTFIMKADGLDADAELNENDNYYGIQASVVPTEFLPLGGSVTRPQPPNPTAGIGLVPAPFYANKDGVRMGWLPNARGRWSAVAVHAVNGANYDIGVYDPATSQTNGFRTNLSTSISSGSKTEIVVMNHPALADHDYDLGVVYVSGTGNYIAESRMAPDNVPMALNSAVNGNLVADQMVAVEEYTYQPTPSVSSVRLRLESTPGVVLRLAVVSPLFTIFSANQFTATVATNALGVAEYDLPVAPNGVATTYALVVYRDMDDGGVAPVAYTLRVLNAPNYSNAGIPGWIGTIGVSNATPGLNVDPATLSGAPTATNVMFGFSNNGNLSATGGSYRLFLDGVTAVDKTGFSLAPAEVVTVSPAFPSITGGRHTLSYSLDYAGAVAEWSETDNTWGKQWAWTPALLNGSASRTAPDAQGGWTHLPVDATPLPNLDAVRATFTPNSSTYWGATLMMPNAGNVNSLTYYAPGSGPFGAFVTPLLGLTKPAGRTAAILADVPVATSYDAGVQRVSGNGGYTIQNVAASDLGALPITTSTQSIGNGQIGKLYSFRTINWLPTTLQVLLQNISGDADLALAVYQHTIGGYGVRDAETTTFSDVNGAGGNEEAVRPIQQDLTQVSILVYKTNAADLTKSVSFALRTNGGAVADVGDALPRELAFALAGENPSRSGSTMLRFDLPSAGEASLELYNVTGQRVRTLASGTRAAGTYTLGWDGRGDGGRALSNGVYFARFRAGSFTRTLRVSLLR